MWRHLLLNNIVDRPLQVKVSLFVEVILFSHSDWLQHVMKHMNLQPLDSHGVDFSRVRMWNLNNWAKHYRQTLVFSSIQDPQINSILTKHCANYRGQVLHCIHNITPASRTEHSVQTAVKSNTLLRGRHDLTD